MADIHAHAPWRRAAAQYSSAAQRHSMHNTWPCNKATYLRDGRVGVETVGQGLSSFWLESVVGDINLFDIQKSRVEENEAASSSTSNKACERSCIANTP